ncbi:alpha/beta-hydrolase [Thelephora terrestris]|uniref:Alpha/beta-hydrolase n=1 Tax=Thelephora terrestris TaxID=56493 RepID=A0A9P6H537_9AGAM|nr:alpha/beta-hydrolase [Thelephora terrestris]
MNLKFWKSKPSPATTLPITAPYPAEKAESYDEIVGEGSIPLIVVEGFCGGAGNQLWGDFADHLNAGFEGGKKRKTLFVKVGPVSSLHDRACELFFTIRGGTVDYGEKHSEDHNHCRHGRVFRSGLYPQWSATKPLHFLGHSMGGTTITKMQDLIKEGFFGDEYHPDMVLSVNTISAPFRGTHAVYTLGEKPASAPDIRLFSVGSFIAMIVHFCMFFAPLLSEDPWDLLSEARSYSCKDISVVQFLKHVWKSGWAESEDIAPYDVTYQSVVTREKNGEGVVNKGTYYTSYATNMTVPDHESTSGFTPSVSHFLNFPLFILSRAMCSYDLTRVHPFPDFVHAIQKGKDRDELYKNDGVVPVFSQWHPLSCRETKCVHHRALTHPSDPVAGELVTGVWNVFTIEGATHASIVPRWTGSELQTTFFRGLGERLWFVEEKWTASRAA